MIITTMKRSFLILLCILFSTNVHGRPRSSVKFSTMRAENPRGVQETLILPYAFSSESMGVTLGVGGLAKGYGQDQLLVAGTAFASFDEAVGGILGMWDYRLPWAERFFFTAFGSVGYYPKQRAYAFPFTEPGTTRFGSNDSDEDDFVESGGMDNWFELYLEYVLPIGAARKSGMLQYRLKDGILQSTPGGGKVWNPFKSGVTNLMIRQYNRYQSYETSEGTIDQTIHPVEFAIYYNNTDFPTNPSLGSSQYLSVTRDFGWLESEST